MLPNCQPNSCRPQAQNLTPLSLWQSCLQMGPRGTRKIQWLTMILRWNCHLIEISPRAVEFTTLQVPKNSKLSCWGKDADVRVEENKWWSLLLHLFEVLLPLWVLKEWLWLSSSKLKALHGVTHQPLVSLKPTASSDLRSVSSGVGICPQLHHLSGGKYDLSDTVMPSNLDLLGSYFLFMYNCYNAKENRWWRRFSGCCSECWSSSRREQDCPADSDLL